MRSRSTKFLHSIDIEIRGNMLANGDELPVTLKHAPKDGKVGFLKLTPRTEAGRRFCRLRLRRDFVVDLDVRGTKFCARVAVKDQARATAWLHAFDVTTALVRPVATANEIAESNERSGLYWRQRVRRERSRKSKASRQAAGNASRRREGGRNS
jgi:hypothetical protein